MHEIEYPPLVSLSDNESFVVFFVHTLIYLSLEHGITFLLFLV